MPGRSELTDALEPHHLIAFGRAFKALSIILAIMFSSGTLIFCAADIPYR
jgi:hypothetical protein